MKTNTFLYKETVQCIPSSDLRNYMNATQMKLSILQKATIIWNYSDSEKCIALFKRLVNESSEDEKSLINSAIDDIQTTGGLGDATQTVYDTRYPHESAPFFPFLERCHLPVLFSPHDIIRYKGILYDVAAVPYINKNCDFSDECYLCYPLSGGEHQHIHVCEAERASNKEVMAVMSQINKTPGV